MIVDDDQLELDALLPSTLSIAARMNRAGVVGRHRHGHLRPCDAAGIRRPRHARGSPSRWIAHAYAVTPSCTIACSEDAPASRSDSAMSPRNTLALIGKRTAFAPPDAIEERRPRRRRGEQARRGRAARIRSRARRRRCSPWPTRRTCHRRRVREPRERPPPCIVRAARRAGRRGTAPCCASRGTSCRTRRRGAHSRARALRRCARSEREVPRRDLPAVGDEEHVDVAFCERAAKRGELFRFAIRERGEGGRTVHFARESVVEVLGREPGQRRGQHSQVADRERVELGHRRFADRRCRVRLRPGS